MILPALFLSHVESMVQSKDRLYKRTNFVAASFTDDGLLLGVAYLLEVRVPRVATPTRRPTHAATSLPLPLTRQLLGGSHSRVKVLVKVLVHLGKVL
jgi:hypothetical protein